jgi:hypothetical protein
VQRPPHLTVEIRVLKPGLQDARVDTDDIVLAVAGDLGKCTVDGDDLSLWRGDGNAFGAAVENRRRLLQALLHTFAVGHVEHDADQTVGRFAGTAVGRLVKNDIAVLAIGAHHLRFVHLRTQALKKLFVSRHIAIGQRTRCDVVDACSNHFGARLADHFEEGLITAEIEALAILVEHRSRDGLDQLVHEVELLR